MIRPISTAIYSYNNRQVTFKAHPDFDKLSKDYEIKASSYFRRGTAYGSESEEYIDIVIKQLELLNPKIVINRITSDPDVNALIEPSWLIKKCSLLNDIDKEMKKRNTYQGIKYKKRI